MAKKFSQLRTAMPAASQARATEMARNMLAQMPLHELRAARGLSQQAMASLLDVGQPSIAKLERRTDMYVSSLRTHVEAMGGRLEIVASFPDGDVRISNFGDLETVPT